MTGNTLHLPILSQRIDWGVVQADFIRGPLLDETLISNISIVPMIGEDYVVMQLDNGKWELTGGTLEPDEPYMDALCRELKEELGAELLSFMPIGYFLCESSADEPYRPHIPHPRFIRLVGYGEVTLVGAPLNPQDGETVVKVERVSITEAIRRFESIQRNDIAELYKLADACRALHERHES